MGAITVTTNVTGAAVKVISGSETKEDGTIGDDYKFTSKKLPNDTYTVKVTKLGYKEVVKEIAVNGDVDLDIELLKEAAPTTATASAIGVKKLQVTLDSTVVDTTKAVVTVKKGTVPVATDKIAFADDNKTINIDTTGKLTKGEYTITISGVADKDLTAKVETADEKVAKIDITTKTAPVTDKGVNAKVNFKVYNQYGEDVTSLFGGQITWTSSTSKTVITTNAAKGELQVPNAGDQAYTYASKLYLTGVHASSGTVANAELTIGVKVQEDAITFKGVYNVATKKIESLPANFKAGKYVLLYDVKDQYGNAMSYKDVNPDNLVFTTTNPLFIDPTLKTDTNTFDVDGTTYLGVKLLPGSQVENGGSATIKVISKNTGKAASFEINATAASQVKTFTLSSPESIVGEGETVEIPFSAVDQYGKVITKYSDIKDKITFNNESLRFKEKSDGTAKLLYTATLSNNHPTDDVDVPVYLTSFVKNGGDFSSLMVYVKAKARPTRVRGLDKSVYTNIGGVSTNKEQFDTSKILIEDQYGRLMGKDKIDTWLQAGNKIVVKSEKPSTDKTPFEVGVENTGTGSFADTTPATITAIVAKVQVAVSESNLADSNATEKVEFSLFDGVKGKTIAASEKEVTFYKVAQSEYVDYAVDDLGTMYNNATSATASDDDTATKTAYNKTVNVYGVKQDGTKVKLLPTQFDVAVLGGAKVKTTSNVISDEDATKGYLKNDFLDSLGKAVTKTVKIEVAVKDDKSGAVVKTINKDLVLSTEEPKVATIGLRNVTDGEATIAYKASLSISELSAFVDKGEVKDQYGVAINNSNSYLNSLNSEEPTVTISNISDKSFEKSGLEKDKDFVVTNNKSKNASISGAAVGDMFTITYTYGDVSKSFVVTVVADA